MKPVSFLSILCVAIALPLSAAGAARTFVSSTGLDTNPCSRTSPCRGFAAALAATAPNGTVIALDSAGYGTLTIGQSVSIVAPEGVYAGIAAPMGATAVTITGTASADSVLLRGLSIEGSGTASLGIAVTGTPLGELDVERCVLTGFATTGIDFEPSNNAAELFMSDTTVRDSGGGLLSYGAPGSKPFVSVDHCRFTGNSYGVSLTGPVTTITNSVVSGNAGVGIFMAGVAVLTSIDRCQLMNNSVGMRCEGGSTTVTNSVVSQNTSIGIFSENAGSIAAVSDSVAVSTSWS